MRLFLAVDLDDRARAALAAEQRRLARVSEKHSAIRWVRPEHLHLTLAFLGEVDQQGATAAASAVSGLVEQARFEVVFEGIGLFPPRGAPRTLWVAIGRGAVELRALEGELGGRLRRSGLDTGSRPFSPHLTLGRWKHSRPSDRATTLSAASSGIVARTWIDRATLYRSDLSSAGPSYTELAHANLKMPP